MVEENTEKVIPIERKMRDRKEIMQDVIEDINDTPEDEDPKVSKDIMFELMLDMREILGNLEKQFASMD